jgi:hypothetical protein
MRDQRAAVGQLRLRVGGTRDSDVPFSLDLKPGFTLGQQPLVGAGKVQREIIRLRSHKAIQSDWDRCLIR